MEESQYDRQLKKLWNYCFSVLAEPDVSEMQANGANQFFVKRSGKREHLEQVSHPNNKLYERGIEIALAPIVQTPFPYKADDSLFEGPLEYNINGVDVKARCHIVLPPACDTPQITIAKRSKSLIDLDSIATRGSMSEEMLSFLKASVDAKMNIVFSGGTGAGKALHKDTLIPTIQGFKKVSEINVGDMLFDEKGAQTTVLKKYCPHDEKSFRIVFDNGAIVLTSAGHLWKANDDILTTQEMFENKSQNYYVTNELSNVQYNKKDLSIDPYVLGCRIGTENHSYIPVDYKTSSKKQRADLIKGLISTVGVHKDKCFTIVVKHEKLLKDIQEIVLSLGWEIIESKSHKTHYSITYHQKIENNKYQIVSIEEVEDNPEDYYCFMVDSESHLFLCTEYFIPTHNTTMLEACTKLIPNQVRIGVAEDTPELQLAQDNVTYLHSTPFRPGYDEEDFPTLPWVVRQFQRMRLDMIIVGETRGKEFAEFLVAANSGFDGSLTTLHANTPKRALERMANFALKGSDRMPLRAINNDIANGIDLIIQLGVLADGRHKVKSITEVTKTLNRGDDATITTQELYRYDEQKDVFVKENTPTDKLREKFLMAGIDTTQAFKLPREQAQSPLGATRRNIGLRGRGPNE